MLGELHPFSQYDGEIPMGLLVGPVVSPVMDPNPGATQVAEHPLVELQTVRAHR